MRWSPTAPAKLPARHAALRQNRFSQRSQWIACVTLVALLHYQTTARRPPVWVGGMSTRLLFMFFFFSSTWVRGIEGGRHLKRLRLPSPSPSTSSSSSSPSSLLSSSSSFPSSSSPLSPTTQGLPRQGGRCPTNAGSRSLRFAGHERTRRSLQQFFGR